ncbi:MAG: hypothetical protein RJB66_365 [Pseudomonadota bacterium]|jgi:hypothetical protein
MKRIFGFINFIFIVTSVLVGCFKGNYDGASTGEDSPAVVTFDGAQSAENINGTTIQLNWNLSTDKTIEEYQIFSVQTDNSLKLIGVTSSDTSTYTVTGLTAGYLQKYVVRAYRKSGTIDTNRKIVSALPYAGISSATVIDQTTVDLAFPGAADAANLRIFCATGIAGAMTLRQQVNSSTSIVRLSSLTTGELYSCKVKAVLPDGSEDQNTTVKSFIPDTVTDPFGFSGLTSAVNSNGTTIQLTWTPATPIAGKTIQGYRVYQVDGDNELDFADVTPSSASGYQAIGLTPGTNYRYMVRAVDSNGLLDSNQVWKWAFTYAGITSASSPSGTIANLFFPTAPSATQLNIYCWKDSDPRPTIPTASLPGTSSSHQVTGLLPSTRYKCAVQAVGVGGEDGNPAIQLFTTPM